MIGRFHIIRRAKEGSSITSRWSKKRTVYTTDHLKATKARSKLQNVHIVFKGSKKEVQVTDEVRTSKNCKVTGTYQVTKVEVEVVLGELQTQ